MEFDTWHFTHPFYLLIILVIPVVWILYFLLFHKQKSPLKRLEAFIDSHLIPYLLVNPQAKERSFWKGLLLWTVSWSCLTLAIAGPRSGMREIETFSSDQSLVIVLDFSESMNATDVKPTRFVRAKQKIEDLLNLSQGVKIGLIAFAADAHMITPITDDKETIRLLLPSLETDLMYIQGSRLSSGLEMASQIFQSEPGTNKALLVISDGGFDEKLASVYAKKLHDEGVIIHTMGVGTLEGAPLYSKRSSTKSAPFSKLEKEKLIHLSTIGEGHYLEAEHFNAEAIVLDELKARTDSTINIGRKDYFWNEHFYLALFPMLPILLWWFRRGKVFLIPFLFLIPHLEADYFKNSDQIALEAFDREDFEAARSGFQDPYRQGVCCYKAKQYAKAEKLFQSSKRDDLAVSALYNLGNCFAMQQKLKEAARTYEEVLKQCPEHENARENLELVKKMLEEQKQSDQSKNDEKKDPPNNDEKNDPPHNDEKKDDESQNKNDEQEPQNQDTNQSESTQSDQKDQEQSEADQDADFWLNKIQNDPKEFLKNKFTIESKKNGTKVEVDPW